MAVLLTHGLTHEQHERLAAVFSDAENAAASLSRHLDGHCARTDFRCPWHGEAELAGVDVASVTAAVDAWCAVGWIEHGLLAPDRDEPVDDPLLPDRHSVYFDRRGRPITVREFAELLDRPDYVRVGRHRLVEPGPNGRRMELSTAWVGVDPTWKRDSGELPGIFQTMVFPDSDADRIPRLADVEARACTEREAITLHGVMLEILTGVLGGNPTVTGVPPEPSGDDPAES